MAPRLLSTAAAPESGIRTADEASAVTLATYLAAVGAAVTTGMPPRSWVEATVAVDQSPTPSATRSSSLIPPAGLRRRSCAPSCAPPIAPASRSAWAQRSSRTT